MRVAYLVNQYPRTSHSFIRREILAVESAGVEVHRFSLRPLDEPLPDEGDRRELAKTSIIQDAGLLAHALAVIAAAVRRPRASLRAAALALRLGWRSDRGTLRHVAYFAEACLLARRLRAARIDHLHAHFGSNSAAVALLCRELGGPPFSFTVHGASDLDRAEAIGLREKIRRASFAVAVCGFGRAQLCRWARDEDWQKLHVVRCGVDDAFLTAPATPVPSGRRLICVARMVPLKGHLVLIEAAARLAAEGLDFELLLVGDGPFRGRIEEAIRRLELSRQIRIAGWMGAAEVRAAIRSSRALVLPSFAEGLPVVIMEALSMHRPVIASALSGIPELVETAVTGWLVPPGSVDALVPAMRAALEAEPGRLAEMGTAGAARVAAHHDARQEARRLIALFQSARAASATTPSEHGAT